MYIYMKTSIMKFGGVISEFVFLTIHHLRHGYCPFSHNGPLNVVDVKI